MLKQLTAASLFCTLLALPAQAADQQSLRSDAISLMGAGVFVPGVAAYCEKYIEHNNQLMNAAIAWNKRHDALLRRVVAVVQWSGGMSGEVRDQLNRAATQMVQQTINGQADKPGYCQRIAAELDLGHFDIRNSELAPAAERIMAAKLD